MRTSSRTVCRNLLVSIVCAEGIRRPRHGSRSDEKEGQHLTQNFEMATGEVIASLEEAIPAAMKHEGLASLLEQQPELAEKRPSTQPTEACIGLSVALIREAECVWAKGFGLRSAAGSEPVTVDSVFSSWSCTKPVSAYAALKLCELGVLDLDRPLCEYVAEPFMVNEPRVEKVTTRMVLSHMSGLSHNEPETQFFHDPGEGFRYSNKGFAFLQTVIEQVTGMSFGQLLHDSVLQPLGLTNSSINWSERYGDMVVDLHNGDGTVHDPEHKFYTSHHNQAFHGLLTTPSEYARFVCELLEPSAEDEFRLSKAGISEMLKPQVKINDTLSWGLGWGIEHSKDGDFFWHHGGFGHNLVMASRTHKNGVVIFTNCAAGLAFGGTVTAALGGNHPILPWRGPWYTPF